MMPQSCKTPLCTLALVSLVIISRTEGVTSTRSISPVQPPSLSLSLTHDLPLVDSLLELRGGAKNRGKKKKNRQTNSLFPNSSKKTLTGSRKVGAAAKEEKKPVGTILQKYKSVPPATRLYMTMVGIVTLLTLTLGEEAAQPLLAFVPNRVTQNLELWRPLTAASFLGPPSIGWLMSFYYLFEYGSNLERAFGTPAQIIFYMTQIFLLSILSSLLSQPFFGQPLITAMLHVLSRQMPEQKVKWLIFTVPYWTLPYGLMLGDVLQSGSGMSVIPHLMGIVTGHFYFFHKFVWTKRNENAVDWLAPPDWLIRRFDPDARKDHKKVNAMLKRKKGKGRKLGTA